MRKIFFSIFMITVLLSCKHKTGKEFEISGTIKNSNDTMVYLQETPLASGERIIADSSVINSYGSFHLKGKSAEESLFNLSLRNETYPFAFVINDAPKITVYADAKNPNDYVIEGSPASKSLREFSINASNKWTNLYLLGREMDSLKKSGAADSVLLSINNQGSSKLGEI